MPHKIKDLIASIILVTIIILVGFYATRQIKTEPTERANTNTLQSNDLEKVCVNNSGKWLAEYQECENIEEKTCTNIGGQFESCGSACRHTQSDMCVTLCVPFCKITSEIQKQTTSNPLNTSYLIEETPVIFKNGWAEIANGPEQSATKQKFSIFDEPTYGDLDGDKKNDAAVIITSNPGGSGTFFYIAGVINNGSDYEGTNGILLGDRIAPQNVEIKDSIITVNYAERKPNEPMTTPPSIGVSRHFIVKSKILREQKITGNKEYQKPVAQ